MTSVIDVNFIDEVDLYNIDYKSEFVTLDPKAIIYRGYDDKYGSVDTLKWYYPFTEAEMPDKKIKKRPLFYGSFQHTLFYTGKPNSDIPGNGPIYRFWATKPLKLWSFNYDNVQKLSEFLLRKNGTNTIAKMIYAFGFLYNNVDQSLQLVNYLRSIYPNYKTDPNLSFLDDLEARLGGYAAVCKDQCEKPYANYSDEDEIFAWKVKDYCYDQCWFETSRLNRIGRKSFYAVDKPLTECLYEYLSRKGYDGIFAWNQVENEYVPWKHHDIIIFDSPGTLITDNVDVHNECREPSLTSCPKRIPPVQIPLKKLTIGKFLSRKKQEEDFTEYNNKVVECFDKPGTTFSVVNTGRIPIPKPVIPVKKVYEEYESDDDYSEISDEPYRK